MTHLRRVYETTNTNQQKMLLKSFSKNLLKNLLVKLLENCSRKWQKYSFTSMTLSMLALKPELMHLLKYIFSLPVGTNFLIFIAFLNIFFFFCILYCILLYVILPPQRKLESGWCRVGGRRRRNAMWPSATKGSSWVGWRRRRRNAIGPSATKLSSWVG